MKYISLILIIISLSCVQNNKEKEPANKTVGAVEIVSEIEESVEAAAEQPNHITSFKKELLNLRIKSVPLVESKSFDSFNNKTEYRTINADVFQLAKIVTYWHDKKYQYQVIDAYQLKLSEDFYTLVVTVLQGDEVMETRLINYDLKGNFIASEMLAYDEIEQPWTRTKSKIKAHTITKHYQYTANEDDQAELETSTIRIEPNGNMKVLSINEEYIELVIEKLNLKRSKLIPKLQAFKILPNNPNEAVVVIPEIVEGSEEAYFFVLDTHIAIVNLKTKQITHQYYESSETNGWVSDAIVLSEVSIDTAAYLLTENERAFGIRTKFIGSSRINPYVKETLSLFLKENNTLKNVLHNFEVMSHGGEWDGNCEGQFFTQEKTLIMSKEKTNHYFDIRVDTKITESKAFENEQGECNSKDTENRETAVLKYQGNIYKITP